MSEWASPDPDYELKRRFAEAWYNHDGNAFAAATDIFGTDNGRCLWVSSHWVLLPEVIAMYDACKAAEPDPELPDAEETAREAYRFFKSGGLLVTGKDRITALKLYSEIRGYINDKGKKGEANTPKQLPDILLMERDDATTAP